MCILCFYVPMWLKISFYIIDVYNSYNKGKNCPCIFSPFGTTGTPFNKGSSESETTPSAKALITKALLGLDEVLAPEPCKVSE